MTHSVTKSSENVFGILVIIAVLDSIICNIKYHSKEIKEQNPSIPVQ
jgi:hypothetical protein